MTMVFPKEEKYELQCEWGQCRLMYEYMNDFYVHLDEHFWKDVAAVPREAGSTLICQWCECNFVTANDHDLIRHLYFHGFHTKLKWLGYLKHQESNSGDCQIHQNRNIIPELPDGFKCCWEECYIVVDIPDKYYDHVRDHAAISDPEELSSGKKGFRCHWEGCTYEYALNGKTASLGRHKLRGHLISHTQERCYACLWCGNLYVNKTKLIDHFTRQINVENHSFQCTHCSRTFASERILKDHMRHHVNHYQCPKCAMTSPNPSALKHHMRYKHSNERPYACEFCDYRSKEPHDLQTHMQFHQSDLSYHCQVADCDYAVRSLQNLRYHYRVKHGPGNGKYYACHLCDKTHGTGYQLTHHLRKNHNFQWPPGHCRFRYKECEDGMYRLQIFRYESIELTKQAALGETLAADIEKGAASEASTSALIKPSTNTTSKPILRRMNIQRQKKGAAAAGTSLRKLRQGRKVPGVATRRSNRKFKKPFVQNATGLRTGVVATSVNPQSEPPSEKKLTRLPDLYFENTEPADGQHDPRPCPASERSVEKTVDKTIGEQAGPQEQPKIYTEDNVPTSSVNLTRTSSEESAGAVGGFLCDTVEIPLPALCYSFPSPLPILPASPFSWNQSELGEQPPLDNPDDEDNLSKIIEDACQVQLGQSLMPSGVTTRSSSAKKQTASEQRFLKVKKRLQLNLPPTADASSSKRHHAAELGLMKACTVDLSPLRSPVLPNHVELHCNIGSAQASRRFEPFLGPSENHSPNLDCSPAPTERVPVVETPNMATQTSIATSTTPKCAEDGHPVPDATCSGHPTTDGESVEVNSSEIVLDAEGKRTVVSVRGEDYYLVSGPDKNSGGSVYCLVKLSEYSGDK